MKNLFLILCISFVTCTFTGCKKEPHISNDTNEKYAPGDLLIGINNNAALQVVFDSLNFFNLKIEVMHGFYYNCNLPKDSINSLINLLNQKAYINASAGWSANSHSVYFYPSENTIRITCSYFNMTSTHQTDFINTIISLNLVDRMYNAKYFHLKVPIGSEKYWMNELKKYSFVKWTALNTIIQLDDHL